MSSHHRFALAVAGVLLGAGALPAQDGPRRVSLEEAVRLLHENSPELALARTRVRRASGEARQARAYPNPSVTATHERVGRDGSERSETYVNVSQRLEWPGRRGARTRAAERTLEAARARFATDSARLVFEVRRAYLEAAAAAERLRVLEEVSAVFRTASRRADERFDAGDVSRYARNRIRLERIRYERSLASARAEARSARSALGALILPDGGGSPATEGLPATLPPELDDPEVGPGAVERHPAIAAARSRADAARAEADLARALRMPDPTVTGGYKTQGDGFDGVFVGISVPLPLLDRKGGAVTAAEGRLEARERRLDLVRRAVERDLSRAAARYRAVRAHAGLADDRLGADGAGLLETARVAYREGEMELVELVDAAGARRDAGVLAAEIRADVWTAYYELIRASGGTPGAPGSQEANR